MSGLISMNVKYCEPTVDLENVFMNSALNYNGPSLCSLRYLAHIIHFGRVSYVFLLRPTHSCKVRWAFCWLIILS